MASEGPDTRPGPLDPITAQRKLVEMREGIAAVASRAAEADLARVFDALERHSLQAEMQARAEAAWDPAGARVAKDAAHHAFRMSIAAAHERATIEQAAGAWLDDINRVNRGVRAVQAQIRREREATAALLAEIDRLCIEAAASRARADAASESSREAERDLARSLGIRFVEPPPPPPLAVPVLPSNVPPALAAQLAELLAPAGGRSAAVPAPGQGATSPAHAQGAVVAAEPSVPEQAALAAAGSPGEPGAASPDPGEPAVGTEEEAAAPTPRGPTLDAVDLIGRPPQALLALLAGDPQARDRIAAKLAGGETDRALVWQAWLQGFADACEAVAIDDGYLEFPEDHSFWGLFTHNEAREIGRSLAALGFRHDGRGGFHQGRVPAPHDLVLAAGSAGLVPVRVRRWPAAEDIANLYREVRVASDELLAERAPYLMLGEVISLLGWRAEPLMDLWNEWSRVRPVLLAPED